MDRRAAIGFLIKSLGVTAALPTIVTTLSGCSESIEVTADKLTFLTPDNYSLVKGISDVILPQTEIVGATDLNIALFVDVMLAQTVDCDLKVAFNCGAQLCCEELFKQTKRSPTQAKFEHYQQLLANFFDISEVQQQVIFNLQNKAVSDVNYAHQQQYYLYKFLLTTREMCLLGFYSNEYVGEHILNYDPIPGKYDACVDAEEIGHAWSY